MAAGSRLKTRTVRHKRTLLVPLWAGLLLLGSPVQSWAAGEAGDLRVHCEHGRVTLRANDVPLDFVLQELAVAANLRLTQHVALDRRVTLDVDSVPVRDVLAELLQEESYQLYAAVDMAEEISENGPIPGALWIFARGSTFVPAAVAYLEIALVEGSLAEKREAIRELRRLGTPEAVQALSMALGDEHQSVRKPAIEALLHIGGDDALAAIASVTADADPLARSRAAEAIALSGGDSARAYLELALGDADPRVRAAAVESLVELNDDQTRSLIRSALQDPDTAVRARALDVLQNLEDEAMFEALLPEE